MGTFSCSRVRGCLPRFSAVGKSLWLTAVDRCVFALQEDELEVEGERVGGKQVLGNTMVVVDCEGRGWFKSEAEGG